jgi:hypothetical protein
MNMKNNKTEQKVMRENKTKWIQIRKMIGRPKLIKVALEKQKDYKHIRNYLYSELNEDQDFGIYYCLGILGKQIIPLYYIVFRRIIDANNFRRWIILSIKCETSEHTGEIVGNYLLGATNYSQLIINCMPLYANISYIGGTDFRIIK